MTDKELLKKLKNNKEDGLCSVIDFYSGLVYKIVSSVILPVGSREDAEECVNDTFLAFYESCRSFDLERASLKTYLALIAKRKAIDYYRKLKAKAAKKAELDNETDGEDFTLSLERKELLYEAVKALGEPDTTIITRKYFLGETTAEIGKELQLSAEAVQKRLERSRLKLKKELGGVFYG